MTLNRVRHLQAYVAGVDAGGPQGDAEITLTHGDYRPGSAHAQGLLLEEAMRHLHEVTPQRVAWARHMAWSRELDYAGLALDRARQETETVQARHDLAVTEHGRARAELARLGLEVIYG